MINIGTLQGVIQLRDEFTTQLNAISKSAVGKFGQAMTTAGVGITTSISAPLAAMGGFAIKAGADFESAFTGVKKSVKATAEEYAALESGIREMAKTIPVTAGELSKIAENAGQLGIKQENILSFTRVMADLESTTTLTGEAAASMSAEFQNIYGQAGDSIEKLGSVISELGNEGASTEEDILSMGVRIASAGYQVGLTQGEVLALANALASLGIEAEAGGSSASRLLIEMANAVSQGGAQLENFAKVTGMTAAAFRQLFRDKPTEALVAFVEGLKRIKAEGGDVIDVMTKMGFNDIRLGNTIRALASGGNMLTESLKKQAEAWEEGDKLTERAALRYSTFTSQLKIAFQQVYDVAIDFGKALIPVLIEVLRVGTDLLPFAKKLAEGFAALPKPVKMIVVALGAFLIVLGPLLIGIGQLAIGIMALTAVGPGIGAALAGFGALVAVPALIAAVGAGLIVLTKRWGAASTAAMQAMVDQGKAQGAAFEFIRKVQQQGGLVTAEQLAAGQTALKEFRTAIEQQIAQAEKLKTVFGADGKKAVPLAQEAEYERAMQHIRNLETQYNSLEKAIGRANLRATETPMSGVMGGSSSVVPKLPGAGFSLGTPLTEEQKKAYDNLILQLNRQAAGLRNVVKAYGESTTAGEIRAQQLDNETQALGQASQYEGKYRDTVYGAAMAVAKLNQAAEEAARLSQLNQQDADLTRLNAAYVEGAPAVAKLRKELALEAAVRVAVGKATGKNKADLEALAKSVAWKTHSQQFKESIELIRTESDSLAMMLDQYRDGVGTFEDLAAARQVDSDIREKTLGLSRTEADKMTEEIRRQAALNKELERTRKVKEILRSLTATNKVLSDQVALDPGDFRTWDEYTDALERISAVMDIEIQYQQESIELGKKQAAINRELRVEALNLAEQLKNNQKTGVYGNAPFLEQMVVAAQELERAFDGVDTAAGRIGKTIAQMVQTMAKAENATDVMVAGFQAASSIIQDMNKGTEGGFGGKGETNYAAIGSAIGTVIGAIIGTIAFGMTAAGAAIGSAIGGIVGSFIKSGAEEALARVEVTEEGVALGIRVAEGPLGTAMKSLGSSINDAIQNILAVLGGTIAVIAPMDIKIRDGIISVFINGMTERFQTMDEAVAFAVTQLLAQSNILNLSDTVRTVLQNTDAKDLEGLVGDIDFAQMYDNIGISDLGLRVQQDMAELRVRLAKAVQLGLDIDPLIADARDKFNRLHDAILGVDFSIADALKGLLDYQEMASSQALALQANIASTQQALNDAVAKGNAIAAAGGIDPETGRPFDEAIQRILDGIPGLKAALASYIAQLDALPKALSDQELSMTIFDQLYKYLKDNPKYAKDAAKWAKFKLDIEFMAIKAQLVALGKWEEFAQMFNDAYNSALNLINHPNRNRGGNSNKGDVKDFIKDKTFDLMTRRMGDYAKAVADINKEYDEQLEKAGKDKVLRAKLLALKEEELRLLGLEIKDELINPYRGGDFSGKRSPFQQQMDDITKAYDDARAVADATGVSIEALNRAERERLQVLGLQAAASAGSRTASTILAMRDLGQTMDFLRTNAVKLGVNFDKLLKEIQGEQFVALGDRLMGFVDKYYAGVKGFEGFRLALEKTRFTLEVANMKLQFSLLRAQGLLTQEAIDYIAGVFGFIDANPPDWDKFFGNSGGDALGSAVSQTTSSLETLMEAFRRAKDDLREFLEGLDRGEMGIVSPADALAAAMEQYRRTVTGAQAGNIADYENLSNAGRNYIEALKAFSPVLAATMLPQIRQELGSLLNLQTVRDGNLIYTERFVQQQTQTNMLLGSGFTDLSTHASEQRAISIQSLDELKKLTLEQARLNGNLESIAELEQIRKLGGMKN